MGETKPGGAETPPKMRLVFKMMKIGQPLVAGPNEPPFAIKVGEVIAELTGPKKAQIMAIVPLRYRAVRATREGQIFSADAVADLDLDEVSIYYWIPEPVPPSSEATTSPPPSATTPSSVN